MSKQDNNILWVILDILIRVLAIMLAAWCIFTAASCSCPSRLPATHTETSIRDSVAVRDSLVIRDSLVLVPIPAEASQNVLPVFTPSHLESSVATSDAWVDSIGLHHTLDNKPTALPAHIPVSEHHITTDAQHTQGTATIRIETVEVAQPLTRWQELKIGAFWWLLAGLFAALLWIFRKPLLKLIRLI
jgi:hypothetical protein